MHNIIIIIQLSCKHQDRICFIKEIVVNVSHIKGKTGDLAAVKHYVQLCVGVLALLDERADVKI